MLFSVTEILKVAVAIFSVKISNEVCCFSNCVTSQQKNETAKSNTNMHARCDMPASCFIRSNANRKAACTAVIYGKGKVTEVGRRRMSFSVLSTHIKHYSKWRYKTIEANRVI